MTASGKIKQGGGETSDAEGPFPRRGRVKMQRPTKQESLGTTQREERIGERSTVPICYLPALKGGPGSVGLGKRAEWSDGLGN